MHRIVAVVLLVAALGACTDSGRRVVTEPCLLQPSEIAAVIHAKVDAGTQSNRDFGPGISLCTYPTDASFAAISLVVQRPGQIAYEEAEADARSKPLTNPRFASIAGLGDRAYSNDDRVEVLQHDAYLTVQAQKPDAAFAAIAQELARQALLHLS